MATEPPYSNLQKGLAWATHIFTASGMVAGFFALILISRHQFIEAAFCLLIAQFIDGIDGTFARAFKVKQVLPHMNGSTMDQVVDFANYAILPAYFLWEGGHAVDGRYEYVLPEDWRWLAISVMLIVSVVYYGKEGMISEDLYFIGFPVLWNMVVYYLFFVIHLPPWINFGLILFFAVSHFVPWRVPYPSRATKFRLLNIFGAVLVVFSNLGLLIALANDLEFWWLHALSLFSLSIFIGLTFYHTLIDRS